MVHCLSLTLEEASVSMREGSETGRDGKKREGERGKARGRESGRVEGSKEGGGGEGERERERERLRYIVWWVNNLNTF